MPLESPSVPPKQVITCWEDIYEYLVVDNRVNLLNAVTLHLIEVKIHDALSTKKRNTNDNSAITATEIDEYCRHWHSVKSIDEYTQQAVKIIEEYTDQLGKTSIIRDAIRPEIYPLIRAQGFIRGSLTGSLHGLLGNIATALFIAFLGALVYLLKDQNIFQTR